MKTGNQAPDDVDDVADDPAPPEDGGETGGRATRDESRGRRAQILLTVAVALVVASAAVAGWFGVAWLRAANDDSLAYSRTRDEVNRVAQNAVITMNELDYRDIDQGLRDWEGASTGKLHDEIVKNRDVIRDNIVQRQSVSDATPLSSAVRELDERAGRATVMVAIRMTVDVTETMAQPPAETPGITCTQVETQRFRCQGDKYQRLEASLQRTDAGWKLAGIGQVAPVQAGQ